MEKKQNGSKTEANNKQKKSKSVANVNVNVNENVNVNVNENVNANEISDSCVDGLSNDSCIDGLSNLDDSCVDGLSEIIEFYDKNIGLITPYQAEILSGYAKETGKDLVIFAIKKASEANIRTIQYIKGILNNWKKAGIKTILEAKQEDEKFREKKNIKQESTKLPISEDFGDLYDN